MDIVGGKMDTTVGLVQKKKFSAGGIFCIVTALAMAARGVILILGELLSVVSYFWDIFNLPEDTFGDQAYARVGIQNAIGSLLSSGAALAWVLSAVLLLVMGIFLLFGVNSKKLVLLSVAQIVLSLASALFFVIKFGVSIVIGLLQNAIIGIFDIILAPDLIATLPYLAFAICWLVFILCTATVKVNKEGKKHSVFPAVLTAILFGAAPLGFALSQLWRLASRFIVLAVNGVMVGKGIVEATTYLPLIDIIFLAAEVIFALVLCVLLAITLFLVTKWLRDPYKNKATEIEK